MIGEIISVLSILFFVTSNAMFRRIEEHASPLQINAIRTSIGAFTYILVILITGLFPTIFKFSGEIWLYLVLSIVLAQAMGDTFYFYTQELLGTTKALAISMTFPLFTFLFSSLIIGSTVYYWFYISAVLITMGVLLIGWNQSQVLKKEEQAKEDKVTQENMETHKRKIRFKTLLAISLGLAASIAWALGIVFTEKVLTLISLSITNPNQSSILANAARFPIAAVLLLGVAWRVPKTKMKTWKKKTWGWMLVASILGTSIGAFLFAEGTRLVTANVMSLIAASSPLFALPITWVLNKEKIEWVGFLGVLLTISGVVLVLVL